MVVVGSQILEVKREGDHYRNHFGDALLLFLRWVEHDVFYPLMRYSTPTGLNVGVYNAAVVHLS